ncbi:MAG: UpxY family transcription antiterminator [Saprospiraceae bacterium]|nr:UpxY family transcription antiterminator [Saprospiraceae bacterium]
MDRQKGTYEVQLDVSEPRWFAVRTKFRAEKVVFKQFEHKGIHSFLPLLSLTRRYKRKIKKVEMPLIPSYIFVQIVKQQYVSVLETELVTVFVKFANELIAISDEEIDLMKRITGENREVEVVSSDFGIGEEVEILVGNLAGTRGRLVEVKQKNKVLIEIKSLGLSLMIEIDTQNLRKQSYLAV